MCMLVRSLALHDKVCVRIDALQSTCCGRRLSHIRELCCVSAGHIPYFLLLVADVGLQGVVDRVHAAAACGHPHVTIKTECQYDSSNGTHDVYLRV